ncbi:MAG: MFS transporter [Chloroflexi bacterium]|nr:MFS transporter [Chloroflexota bacterium]
MQGRIFYGWVIVGVLFVVNFAAHANGQLNFGLFVIPMSTDLGMSRSLVGWAQTAKVLAGSASSFVIGRLLDRHGPRLLVAVASLVTAAGVVGLASVRQPWQFVALFALIGLMGLATPGGGGLMTSVPVAKWFVRQRGRAMALATLGLGVGAVVFLPFTQVLISGVGWRKAWLLLAATNVVMTVPLALLLLRRQPEDMGLTPDGEPAPVQPRATNPVRHREQTWTAQEALATPTLKKLLLAFGLMGLAMGGASVHRIPYWVERGFDPQLVSYSFAVDAAGAASMVLLAGIMAERVPVRFIATASYLGFAVAVGLMLVGSNSLFLFGSTAVFGISVGANMIVQGIIWADYYGRAFLGTIRGIVTPVTLVGMGIGAPFAGYVYDFTGSYAPAWWLFIGIYVVAALVMLGSPPPKHPVLAAPVAPKATAD